MSGSDIMPSGPFPAILRRGIWLELGKTRSMQHYENFLEVLNSKKKHGPKNTYFQVHDLSHVYMRVISYKCNHLYWGCNIASCSASATFVRSKCLVVKFFEQFQKFQRQ